MESRTACGKKRNCLRSGSKWIAPSVEHDVLRDSLHPILKRIGREKCGFHIFRRFRASWLRKKRVPWDL
jgi:hypothetical protein